MAMRGEEEVSHSEVEESNVDDGLLHLEAHHPDSHTVPKDAQNKGQAVNNNGSTD